MIDIGVNLGNRAFADDLETVLERAAAASVLAMVATGTTVKESRKAAEIAARFPRQVVSTAGVHPHHADSLTTEGLQELRQLAALPEVVAIGETGLDFNRDFSPRPDQEKAFAAQLELAVELEMPVFIHQRDAHARLLPILREYRDDLVDAVVHCFTDTREALHDYLDLDLYIGVTGWICDERRGETLRGIVRDIPANRLLIESDAPYLLPRTLKPKPKNGRNEPAYLGYVLEGVAEHRGEDLEQLGATTSANARRFFRLGRGLRISDKEGVDLGPELRSQ
nr:TatD family hydrolase [Methylonatrum kenyense]